MRYLLESDGKLRAVEVTKDRLDPNLTYPRVEVE
jgi:hypothetical protein